MSYKDEIYRRKYLKYRAKYEEMLKKVGGSVDVSILVGAISNYPATTSANDITKAFDTFKTNIKENEEPTFFAFIDTQFDETDNIKLNKNTILVRLGNTTKSVDERKEGYENFIDYLKVIKKTLNDRIDTLFQQLNNANNEIRKQNIRIPQLDEFVKTKEDLKAFLVKLDKPVEEIQTLNVDTSLLNETTATSFIQQVDKYGKEIVKIVLKFLTLLPAIRDNFERLYDLNTAENVGNIVSALDKMNDYKTLSRGISGVLVSATTIYERVNTIENLKTQLTKIDEFKKDEFFKYTTYSETLPKEVNDRLEEVKKQIVENVQKLVSDGIEAFKNFKDLKSYRGMSDVTKDGIQTNVNAFLDVVNKNFNSTTKLENIQSIVTDLMKEEVIRNEFKPLIDLLKEFTTKIVTGNTYDAMLNELAKILLGHELGNDPDEDSDSPIKVTVHYVKKPTISQIFIPQQVFMHQGFTPFDIVPRHHRKHHHRR